MVGAHSRVWLSHEVDWAPIYGVVGWFVVCMSGSALTCAGLEGSVAATSALPAAKAMAKPNAKSSQAEATPHGLLLLAQPSKLSAFSSDQLKTSSDTMKGSLQTRINKVPTSR